MAQRYVISARKRPEQRSEHARAAAVRFIRRSGRRPALSMGAGLSPARRCGRRGRHPRAGGGDRAGLRHRLVRAGLDPRGDGRPRRRHRRVRRGARRRPRGLSRRAAASGPSRRRRGDAVDDRRLCAAAVRPARAGFRHGAGGAARLSRAGAAAGGGSGHQGHAVAAWLGARSRLRHGAWRRGVPAVSATGWSASIFRPA